MSDNEPNLEAIETNEPLAKEAVKAARKSRARVKQAMTPKPDKVVEKPVPGEGPTFAEMVKQAQALTKRRFAEGSIGKEVKRGATQVPNRNPVTKKGSK